MERQRNREGGRKRTRIQDARTGCGVGACALGEAGEWVGRGERLQNRFHRENIPTASQLPGNILDAPQGATVPRVTQVSSGSGPRGLGCGFPRWAPNCRARVSHEKIPHLAGQVVRSRPLHGTSDTLGHLSEPIGGSASQSGDPPWQSCSHPSSFTHLLPSHPQKPPAPRTPS